MNTKEPGSAVADFNAFGCAHRKYHWRERCNMAWPHKAYLQNTAFAISIESKVIIYEHGTNRTKEL